LLAACPADLPAAAARLASDFAQGYSAVLAGRQALEGSGLRNLELVEIPN
jgi:hypothetical protein